MRIAVLWKRRYMGNDVITDRYARLYELPLGLAQDGHAVLALCLSYRHAQPERRVDPISGPGSLVWQGYNAGPGWVGGLPGYWRSALAQLRAFRPDVLLGGSDAPHAVLTQHFARRLGLPYYIDLYDNFESFGLTRIPGLLSLYRRALCGASGIAAVSDLLAEYVRTLAPGVPVITLESTIDPERFFARDRQAVRARLGLPAQGRLVGVSGSLARSRGVDLVYESFLRLSADDPTLYLVLAGDLDRRMPPPRHPRVLYLGRIPHAEMPYFFSAIDLALIPMLDTAFGRYAFPQKAYEIMACGTPLLTARVGALARTLADYPACLYDGAVPGELDRGIRRQLTEPLLPPLPIPSWTQQSVRLAAFMAEQIPAARPRAAPEF